MNLESDKKIPVPETEIPCSAEKLPCSFAQGISLQASEFTGVLAFESHQAGRIQRNSLFISLLAGNLRVETGSNPTASTTTQSFMCRDFVRVAEKNSDFVRSASISGTGSDHHAGLQLWIAFLLRRQLKLDSQRGVALCLLGEPQKSRCQIFKPCSYLRVSLKLCSGEQFKRFCPIAIPRAHRQPFVRLFTYRTNYW
ncbi:MAG TPA: hypothetical protein VI216_10830 [Candidatus Acidoferrales bacterium]